MYTEERKSNLLKEFLLKLILIIIFVLLLIWLVPWPNMDSYMDALNPLKSQIFNSNIQEMKDAAITYFTSERLPQNVGDKKTLTLQQMLDMKLLIPFVDKNGDSCDVTASYVMIEKQETEYLMKVNLKCGEEENYILVHLGCYAYCTTDICEKKETIVTPVKPVIPGTKPTPKPTNRPTNVPTYVPTPSAIPTNRPTPPIPTYNPTSKPTPTPTNKPTPTPTNKPTPTPTNRPTPTPTNKPTPTPTTKPSPTPTYKPNKKYEYVKTVEAHCADWSSWTTSMLKKGQSITPVNTMYRVVEDLGTKRVQVGVVTAKYQKVYVTTDELVQVSTYNYKVCKNYSYVVSGGTVYQVSGDWTYSGKTYTGATPPRDTATSRWIPVGVDWENCKNDCVNHPITLYKEQVRSGTAYSDPVQVTATCTDVETRSLPVYVNTKKTTEKTVMVEPEKPLYGNIHFYREKTCNSVVSKKTYKQCSTYNDQSLLNDGYGYSGKYCN